MRGGDTVCYNAINVEGSPSVVSLLLLRAANNSFSCALDGLRGRGGMPETHLETVYSSVQYTFRYVV